MMLIVLAIVVFAIAMFGAIAWSIAAWKKGLSKWHHIGAIFLAIGGSYFFIDTSGDMNEFVLLFGILFNVSAIIHSGIRLRNNGTSTMEKNDNIGQSEPDAEERSIIPDEQRPALEVVAHENPQPPQRVGPAPKKVCTHCGNLTRPGNFCGFCGKPQ
jgi:hypothetical protein